MKKVLIILGALFVVFLAVLVSLPFFIDVDKYRPQIKAEVEKRINGQFDLGKLTIKGLGVLIQDLKITSNPNFKNQSVMSVGEAEVKLSFKSLLSMRPEATVVLKKPEITIVKNNQGVLNLSDLPKKEGVEKAAIISEKKEKPKKEAEARGLPAFIVGAKLSFLAKNASLKYLDETTDAVSMVNDLNISLKNISLNQPIEFAISALLSSETVESSLFQQKIAYSGKAKVLLDNSQKLTGFELDSELQLGELTASINGKLTDLDNLRSDFKIKTPVLSIAKLKNQFAGLKKYNLDGTASLEASLRGQLKKLDQCRVDGKFNIYITQGETDLKFSATLKDTLNKLRSEFAIEASALNLDEILPKKPESSLESILKSVFQMPSAIAETKPVPDPFKGIRKSPIFQGLRANGRVNIKKIIYNATDITNVLGQFNVRKLKFAISKFGLNAFNGRVHFKGDFDISPQQPTYELTTVVQGLYMNPMVSMASSDMKNVVFGNLNANMRIQGKGISFEEVKNHMTGQGRVELKNAELKGLNMAEKLNAEMKVLAIFAGTTIFGDDVSPKFNSIRSSLIIKNGKLFTPDAIAEAPEYGAKLKGFASFDKEIAYQGKLLVSASKFQSRSLASLADSKGLVGFPFTLRGKLPKYDFSVDAGAIAKMAAEATLKDAIRKKTGIDIPFELPF